MHFQSQHWGSSNRKMDMVHVACLPEFQASEKLCGKSKQTGKVKQHLRLFFAPTPTPYTYNKKISKNCDFTWVGDVRDLEHNPRSPQVRNKMGVRSQQEALRSAEQISQWLRTQAQESDYKAHPCTSLSYIVTLGSLHSFNACSLWSTHSGCFLCNRVLRQNFIGSGVDDILFLNIFTVVRVNFTLSQDIYPVQPLLKCWLPFFRGHRRNSTIGTESLYPRFLPSWKGHCWSAHWPSPLHAPLFPQMRQHNRLKLETLPCSGDSLITHDVKSEGFSPFFLPYQHTICFVLISGPSGFKMALYLSLVTRMVASSLTCLQQIFDSLPSYRQCFNL